MQSGFMPDMRKGRGALRKIGAIGFLFFLVKGLLWLCVPAVLALLSRGIS